MLFACLFEIVTWQPSVTNTSEASGHVTHAFLGGLVVLGSSWI